MPWHSKEQIESSENGNSGASHIGVSEIAEFPGVSQLQTLLEDLAARDADSGSHVGSTDGHPLATVSADGFMAAEDKAKLNGVESGATADQTAQEILDSLKTVDGSASGLDADLLDGSEASTFQARSEKGQANGYVPLDSGLLIPQHYLPAVAIASRFIVNSEAAQIGLTAQEGDVAIRTDLSRSYIHNGGTADTMADWSELLTPTDQVQSVDGRTGTVTLNDLYAGLIHKSRHATGGADAIAPADIGASATGHAHSGTDITSGTVDVARIGSGTKDTTTFYRGDGSFQVPPSGAHTIRVADTDQTQRANLNFAAPYFTSVDDATNNETEITLLPATESRVGVAEIATSAEATEGTDDARIMTPKKTLDVTIGRGPGVLLTDHTNLQAAMDAVPSGGALIVPPGVHTYPGIATSTNKAMTVKGFGKNISEIRFTGAATTAAVGFDFTLDLMTKPIHIEDLLITTDQAGIGTAVKAIWPSSAASRYEAALFSDVEIRGLDPATHYWNKGVSLQDAWKSSFRRANIWGRENTRQMVSCVELLGMCVETDFSQRCLLYFADRAITSNGRSEGIHFTDSAIVFCTRGMHLTSTELVGGLFVTASHMNTFERGVSAQNHPFSEIQGSTFFKRPESTLGYVGVELYGGSSDSHVAHNHFRNAGTSGGANSITIANSTRCQVVGNNSRDHNTLVWLQSGADYCIASLNNRAGGTNTVVDQGFSNTVVNNV